MYKKAANDIKVLKIEWNAKMCKMEMKSDLKKDNKNNQVRDQMCSDLAYLKAEEKNIRWYKEIRYAKYSCLNSDIKRKAKNELLPHLMDKDGVM